MIKIKWLGVEGFLPIIGLVTNGVEFNAPTHLANNYIKQGLAKEVKPIKKPTKKEAV